MTDESWPAIPERLTEPDRPVEPVERIGYLCIQGHPNRICQGCTSACSEPVFAYPDREPEPGSTWDEDSIQFPRLLAELEAAGAFTPEIFDTLAGSMDLSPAHIRELIVRADDAWERAKGNR